MIEFDPERHLIRGDAEAARSWISDCDLPEDQKADLLRFVAKFQSLTFTKDDDAILDHYAETDRVTLPQWFRNVRSTLACVDPQVHLRVDDFQWYHSPRSDDVDDIWYELRPGYHGNEERELLASEAGIYRIAVWYDTDESYLGIDLHHPEDQRVFDFSYYDLLDDKLAGRPVRGSLYPVFSSYPQFLAHVAELRFPGGTSPNGDLVPARRYVGKASDHFDV